MFKKIKYKLWRHLTKELVPDKRERDKIISLEKYAASVTALYARDKGRKNIYPSHIINAQGLGYSGSSTLIGLFSEFDNIRVIGYPEPAWCKNKVLTSTSSECRFFRDSRFFDFIHCFSDASEEEQDATIKLFIRDINRIYQTHQTTIDYIPELYGEKFYILARKLLFNLLELDEKTIDYMKKHNFPSFGWEEGYPWTNCSFVKNREKNMYLFYRFKKLSKDEFKQIISEFLVGFFRILGGCEIAVYDQLLDKYLDHLNYFLDNPIKQICVTRDPRDRYLSGLIEGASFHTDIELYCKDYEERIHALAPNSNRLVVRFEDIVLNYNRTKNQILDFLAIDPSHHISPKLVFDPAISAANIGHYRSYHNQNIMKEIENRLHNFCFIPEKEDLSAESIAMLKKYNHWVN